MNNDKILSYIKLTLEGEISREIFWKYIWLSFLFFILACLVLLGLVLVLSYAFDLSVGELVFGNFAIIGQTLIFLLFFPCISFYCCGHIRRLRSLKKPEYIALLCFVPFINLFLLIYCGYIKGNDD